jgi:pseudouridylate synthase
MDNLLSKYYMFSPEIRDQNNPSSGILALESAVITHGLPKPINYEIATALENSTRDNGVIPATIAVIEGIIHIGLTNEELQYLAAKSNLVKISRRDFGSAIFHGQSGGTTVAGTMFAAYQAGIRVFATGGIGGVHEVETLDISTDLQTLSDTPMIVVCSGAKSILDLHATLEYLETMSVPVIGYGTKDFPGFYSRQSGLHLNISLNSPEEVIKFAQVHWDLGLKSAVLVCQPIPESCEIPLTEIESIISKSKAEAKKAGIFGQKLTPFLLSRISEMTNGKSLEANRSLLLNNAKLGSEIAKTI